MTSKVLKSFIFFSKFSFLFEESIMTAKPQSIIRTLLSLYTRFSGFKSQ